MKFVMEREGVVEVEEEKKRVEELQKLAGI